MWPVGVERLGGRDPVVPLVDVVDLGPESGGELVQDRAPAEGEHAGRGGERGEFRRLALPIFGQDGQPEYQIEIHLGRSAGLTLGELDDALRHTQQLLAALP